MKFLIVTHVPHVQINNRFYGYAPYIREMNIWLKYVDEIIVIAPLENKKISEIDLPYEAVKINFEEIPAIELTSFVHILETLFKVPKIVFEIFKAMKSSDHIHLRCPGNIGLLGSIVQILFPNKRKSAKYAGNWDPNSKQPWSYRLQKWILSNTFLTKNMQVLVYGEWPSSTKNIKSFFTASYSKNEIIPIQNLENEKTFRFIFAGSLVKGKNPNYAIQLIKVLKEQLVHVRLDIYGNGVLISELQNKIAENNLQSEVFLHGNQSADVVKKAFQNSHFVILPSKSEGWPKVIAEGMFWGCVPLATPVSCVPNMLGNGSRGLTLTLNVEHDLITILALINEPQKYQDMRKQAANWSRIYTTDYFESEIKIFFD
jgi:glycosyltransferase involved in cell wall biosynthesis